MILWHFLKLKLPWEFVDIINNNLHYIMNLFKCKAVSLFIPVKPFKFCYCNERGNTFNTLYK